MPRAKTAPSMEDTTPSVSLVEAIQDLSDVITYCEEHGVPHADRLAKAVASAQPTDFTPEFVKGLKELRGRAEAMSRTIIAPIDAGLAAGKQGKPERKGKAAPEAKPTPTKRKASPTRETSIAISQNTKAALPPHEHYPRLSGTFPSMLGKVARAAFHFSFYFGNQICLLKFIVRSSPLVISQKPSPNLSAGCSVVENTRSCTA